MKTLLDVDDGSSATFYCRCGRRAREVPYDGYHAGIEFWCRKHGWVATWREDA